MQRKLSTSLAIQNVCTGLISESEKAVVFLNRSSWVCVFVWECNVVRSFSPVLYQCVGLCVGVVALFQVSSGVQQRFLRAAEFSGLGQVARLALWQCGGSSWLPLLYCLSAGGAGGGGEGGRGGLRGRGGQQGRPLGYSALLRVHTSLSCGFPTRRGRSPIQQEVHS